MLSFLRRAALYAVILLIAFSAVCAFSFPLTLFADRFLFPRLKTATGLSLSASSLEPALPFSLAAKNLTVEAPSNRGTLGETFERLTFTPGWGILLGEKSGTVKGRYAGGTLEIDISGDRYHLSATDLTLSQVGLLKRLSSWKTKGSFHVNLDGNLKGEGGKPAGKATLQIRKFGVEKAKIAGLEFPKLDFGELTGTMELKNGRFELGNMKTSGGSTELVLSGGITAAEPLSNSSLNILIDAKITPAGLEPLKGSSVAQFLERTGGMIRVSYAGPLADPQLAFR